MLKSTALKDNFFILITENFVSKQMACVVSEIRHLKLLIRNIKAFATACGTGKYLSLL